jgi:ATP-dependent protease ClpP protease subunit
MSSKTGYSSGRVGELLASKPILTWLGKVDEAHSLDAISALGEIIQIRGGDSGSKLSDEIIMIISSHGGDLNAAFAFYDFVRLSKLNLVTIATGDVQSFAVMLFLAGKERYASRNASFLIHDPTMISEEGVKFSLRDMPQVNKQIEELHERFLEIMSKETGLSKEKVDEMARLEMPISPKRAVELGIAHHII